MTNEELELIMSANAEAQIAVNLGEALKRLLENKDYQLIVSNGFMKDYPKVLGEAIATNTGAYDSDKLVGLLKGINSFIGYTFQIAQNSTAGEQTIRDNEEYITQETSEAEGE